MGQFRFYDNNRLLAVVDNTITTEGSRQLLRYMSGQQQKWAGAVAVGISNQTPTVNDRALGFEFARSSVDVKVADLDSSSVIIKGTLPQLQAGQIYEAGVFSDEYNVDTDIVPGIISSFDPVTQNVTGGTSATTNVRIGERGLLMTGTTATVTHASSYESYNDTDRFTLALHSASTNTVTVRFKHNVTDYFEYNFSPVAGYDVHSWLKSAFVAVGNASWTKLITSIDIVVSGGTVMLDGLRADDLDIYSQYGLISRAVFTQPLPKTQAGFMDFEYTIGLKWI